MEAEVSLPGSCLRECIYGLRAGSRRNRTEGDKSRAGVIVGPCIAGIFPSNNDLTMYS